MSRLGGNDAHLHYEDGSHRWFSADGEISDTAWRALVEAHLQEHRVALEAEGGSPYARTGFLRRSEVGDDLPGGA